MARTATGIVPAIPRRGLVAAQLVAAIMLGAPRPAHAQGLPLGDGRVTDHPAVGNVYACHMAFRTGGAAHSGPWIRGETWYPAQKPHVSGRVFWPDARYSLTLHGDDLVYRGNGLPVRESTGVFPIAPADSVYRYDTNPNHVRAQHLDVEIPAHPSAAARPQCLPMGMIGFTVTGVAIYDALDAAGRDAAAHEIQDDCDGHPQANGEYHYHSGSPCMPGVYSDSVVGWALDGYPILGMKDATGAWILDTDLDVCHGAAERVVVDDRTYHYAYHLTREYPYTLGCFHGAVSPATMAEVRAGLEPARGGRGRRSGRGGRGGTIVPR